MFEISGTDITSLSDADLRSLVFRLAAAELRAKGYPLSSITAGGDQDAADGGLDVRIECPTDITNPDFVPRRSTGIQVKKPDMPPAAIRKEMRPKGILRDTILELAADDIKGWVRPKYLSSSRAQDEKASPPSTHQGLIGELLIDCQNQLIPIVNLIENGRALRALAELCPDSTPSQRMVVRKALHLMANEDFVNDVKEKGGIPSLAPSIKAATVAKDPSLLGNSCLLDVIDETVVQLLTHPFGF